MKQPAGWAGVMGESEHRPVINRLGCQAKERRFSPKVPGDSERTVGRGGMGADLCFGGMPLAVARRGRPGCRETGEETEEEPERRQDPI